MIHSLPSTLKLALERLPRGAFAGQAGRWIGLVVCGWLATPLAAQPVIEALPVTRPQVAEDYRRTVRPAGIDTEAVYARRITGDLSEGQNLAIIRDRDRPSGPDPVVTPGAGLFIVIGGIVALLLVWLRFGGGGMLLARNPTADAAKSGPADWTDAAATDLRAPGDVLAQIAAMTDRRAAMIALLRYCLQVAASQTNVRYARSDTEREALRRLPGGWGGLAMLRHLLRETELAHYGGRAVSEDAFQSALRAASQMLGRAGQGGRVA